MIDNFNNNIEKCLNEIIKIIQTSYQNFDQIQIVPNSQPKQIYLELKQQIAQVSQNKEQIIEFLKLLFNEIIPKNTTQWQHPKFFAYYPSNMSHSTILANMICSIFKFSDSFCSQMQKTIIQFIANSIDLQQYYKIFDGIFTHSITEGFFLTVHYAKQIKSQELKLPNQSKQKFNFAAYFSSLTQIWAKKALFLKNIQFQREIPIIFDVKAQNYQMDVENLNQCIQKDIQKGLIPFWCGASIGSTNVCGVENIDEIGKICQKNKIFLHVDAAYAGTSWICPELRQNQKGLQYSNSLSLNFAKNMSIANQGAILFVQNFDSLQNLFNDFSQDKEQNNGVFQRCTGLKFYIVFKSIGINAFQNHWRRQIQLAQYFEQLIISNSKYFCMITKRELTLICFQVLPSKFLGISNSQLRNLDQKDIEELNCFNENFLKDLNQNSQEGFLTAGHVDNLVYIRFVVCNPNTIKKHIDEFWGSMQKLLQTYK